MSKVFSISEAKSIAEFSDVAQLGKEYAAWDIQETTALGLSVDELLAFQHDYRPELLKAKFAHRVSRCNLFCYQSS